MTILNRSNNNRSVLWKWTFSYLCLLFIPTLTIFINYFTNLSALKKEYTNAYQLMLQNYEITLNDKTTNMHNFYNYVVNLDSFNSIIKYQTKDKYFYNTSYLLQQALFQNKYGNDDLNCTIYLSQVDFIASSNNSCHRLLFHSSLQDSSDLIPEYEEWQDFMSGHFTENCFINTNLSDSNSPCLIYAQTLFRGLKGPVTIFISTPLDKIFTTIGNMQNGVSLLLHTADNKLFLLDKNGITATNEELFLDNNLFIISTKEHITNNTFQDENAITCYLLVSKEVFNKNLQLIRLNFLTCILLTILISIIVMIYMLHSNYRPITNLMSEFDLNNSKGNEFSIIIDNHKQLHSNLSASKLTILHQKQELLNSKLLSILKGRMSEAEQLKIWNDYNIDANNNCSLVGFMITPVDEQKMKYDDLIFFLVNNIFCDLFQNDNYYHIEDGCFIYYLFVSENLTSEVWYADTCEKLDYLCNLVIDKFACNIVASISEPGTNLMHCKFLHKNIIENFELQELIGGNGFVNNSSKNIHNSYDSIREYINIKIHDAIKSGNQIEALSISDQLFLHIGKMPFSTVKTIIFNIFSNTIELYSTYTTDSIQQMHALNHVNSIMQSDSLDKLSFSFKEYIQFICDDISRKYHNESNEIIINIQNIVIENYNNKNLSVSFIADSLGRNSKYISRLFKEGTGIGLLDYINQYRICEAQKIMNSKKYTVEKIAEMVGYDNVQTFRRSFVKYTGKTPSEFGK
ncbi:MAG: helix-turn-helix transcriptional regulator [Lachnospiraceae bacterium]|nr:helix-turn-helix transcriptional regulator [Lachnospiraceae bacterium]